MKTGSTYTWFASAVFLTFIVSMLLVFKLAIPLAENPDIHSLIPTLIFLIQPLLVGIFFLFGAGDRPKYSLLRVVGYVGTFLGNLFPLYIFIVLKQVDQNSDSFLSSGLLIELALSSWVPALIFAMVNSKQNGKIDRFFSVWLAFLGILTAMGVLWVTAISSAMLEG